MPSLRERLSQGNMRKTVVSDAQTVLDAEVDDKGGLSGMAIKGAYKVVKGIKPGFIPEVIDALLEDFLDALDPLYQEAITGGQKPGAFLVKNQSRMADALLAITDGRAERSKNGTVRKLYEKLRPTAKKHVEAAAPRLGALLERHAT